jgi:hypothetical protein
MESEGGLPAELLEEQRRELRLRERAYTRSVKGLSLEARASFEIEALRAHMPAYSGQVRARLECADGDKLELL